MPLNADHIAAQSGAFEPQRQNNFSIEFYGLDGDDKNIFILALKSIDSIPGHENAPVILKYQNEERRVAGPATTTGCTIALHDFVDQETRNAMLRWRRKVYDPATGAMGLAKDYKKEGAVILHAPDGSNERVCRLIGSWPDKDPKGALNMNTTEPVQLDLSISVDKVQWDLA